jgi:alpha-N-arabinofuranosidase
LRPGTLEFKQYLADQIVAISPAVMRYPGGSLTDTYHWLPGMGPIGSRGMVENAFTKVSEPAYFGTKEFLSLCALTGAEPLISLNVVTGDAQEAADWVSQTNVTGIEANGGGRLPSVNFCALNKPATDG